MKLRKLKCTNCGANLEVEEDTKIVECKYCKTRFSVEDAYSDGYKFEKGRQKAIEENFKNIGNNLNFKESKKIGIVILCVFIFMIVSIIGFVIFNIGTVFKFGNDMNISSFNSRYEMNAGLENGFFISNTLDDIVTNNKTNKNHIITVIYNDIEASDENEIKEIRNQLSTFKYYDVSYEYNKKGYIYKMIISDNE